MIYHYNRPAMIKKHDKLNPLKRHHPKLSKDQQIKRMAIMRACKWSRPTFYNKLNDPASICPAHQEERKLLLSLSYF